MRFASFLSGGFITAIVVNPPERKLAKRTSVQWGEKLFQEVFLLLFLDPCVLTRYFFICSTASIVHLT